MTTYQEQARLLRLMAHPMRLEILTILRGSDECVCHLSAALKKPQPYVSQQLAVLRKEGLITDRNEGTYVYYGLGDGPAAEQAAAMLRVIAPEAPSPDTDGHECVAGCDCPKCDVDGRCCPPPTVDETRAGAVREEEVRLP